METSKKFRKKILDQCHKEFQQGDKEEEVLRELEAKLAEADDDRKPSIKMELDEKKCVKRMDTFTILHNCSRVSIIIKKASYFFQIFFTEAKLRKYWIYWRTI